MSQAIPSSIDCCDPCESPLTTTIPGVPGSDGLDGIDGSGGLNAFTVLTAGFTTPAEGADVTITVGDTSWMVGLSGGIKGQIISIAFAGFYEVRSVTNSTQAVVRNLRNTAASAYFTNASPGVSIPSSARVSPSGLQGPGGALASGGLLSVNNLLDLYSISDSRENLGVAIGSNVQAYSPALDAIVGLSGTGIVVRTGSGTFTTRAITGTSGEIIVTNGSGVSGAPTISLDPSVYRAGGTVVAIADGGTGQSTKTAAFDALSPLTTEGDIIFLNSSGSNARLAIGATGTVLHGGTDPSWSSVNLAADVTGVLPVANGGTGQSTWTSGGLLYASGATTLANGSEITYSGGVLRLAPSGYIITGNQTVFRFLDSAGGHYLGLRAGATIGTSFTLTLPTTDGTNGYALITDGAGTLSWGSIGGGGGTGLTSLNGLTAAVQTFANDTNVQISSATATHTITWAGTLAAGRLNSNVVQGVTVGTNISASIAAQVLTIGLTGQVGVANGGSGAATFTKGILVSPGGTTAFTTVAGTEGHMLVWSSSYPSTTGPLILSSSTTLETNGTVRQLDLKPYGASSPSGIRFFEGSSGGTDYCLMTGAANMGSAFTLILPDSVTSADGKFLKVSVSGSIGTLSFDSITPSFSGMTQYGLAYWSTGGSPSTIASTLAGNTTTVLHGNPSGAPTWSQVSLTGDVTGTLPMANGGTNSAAISNGVVISDGTTLSSVSGSDNYLPKWSSGTFIDSAIHEGSGTVLIGPTSGVVGLQTSGGTATALRFYAASGGSHYTAMKGADSISAITLYTLPSAYPAATEFLVSDTGGAMSWFALGAEGKILGISGGALGWVTNSGAFVGTAGYFPYSNGSGLVSTGTNIYYDVGVDQLSLTGTKVAIAGAAAELNSTSTKIGGIFSLVYSGGWLTTISPSPITSNVKIILPNSYPDGEYTLHASISLGIATLSFV